MIYTLSSALIFLCGNFRNVTSFLPDKFLLAFFFMMCYYLSGRYPEELYQSIQKFQYGNQGSYSG